MGIPMITIMNKNGTEKYKLPLYLHDIVIENSENKSNWWRAVEEWSIDGYSFDKEMLSKCVCSKPGLKILFRIKNDINGNVIFPIGSTCIKRFGRVDLSNNVDIYEKSCDLLDAFEDERKKEDSINIDTKFFSRNSIDFYQSRNAINSIEWEFLKRIFNRKFDTLSMSERSKKNEIIRNKIIPYIKSNMRINMEKKPKPVYVGKGNISISVNNNTLYIYRLSDDYIDDKSIGDFVHPKDNSYLKMMSLNVTFNEAVEMMNKLVDPDFNGLIEFQSVIFDFSKDFNNNGREELWRCFRTIAINLGGSVII